MRDVYVVLETYDRELDLIERHRVSFEQFFEMLRARVPELERVITQNEGENNG